MDISARRALLETALNPAGQMDYLVSLGNRVSWIAHSSIVAVRLRYVPDRLIVKPGALQTYLASLAGDAWDSLEAFAATVLEDASNELVPRWLQLSASEVTGLPEACEGHLVLLEDRQPRWDNPALLAQIRATPSCG